MVEELISAIGNVTLGSKDAIEETRAAYDALSDSQKNLVENYDELVAAENKYAALLKAKELPFTDIENHWATDAVSFVFEKEIMTGTAEDKFSPDMTFSRGMMVTTLYRLVGAPDVKGENPFSDVNGDEWYADAVKWAYENKIISGYTDGTFGANDDITREQFALMLANYAKLKGVSVTAEADLSKFADGDDVSLWALDAVKWAVSEGLITGRDTGLAPVSDASRAEAATILMRWLTK